MITADHGNDPTWTGSDHTREMIPLLIYSKAYKGSGILPQSTSFANIGATIAEYFNVAKTDIGTSYKDKLI